MFNDELRQAFIALFWNLIDITTHQSVPTSSDDFVYLALFPQTCRNDNPELLYGKQACEAM